MSWTQPAFERVARLVSRRTGLSFAHRTDHAESGILRAMARSRTPDLTRYAALLEANEKALDDLVNELTVGETYFFREPAHFRFIQQTVLPELRERRGPQHTFRMWSAACASGEEAYSLAIVMQQEGLLEQTHLIATDISRTALAKARAASYEAWSLRGESAKQALPYLTRIGKRYQLLERIRRRVTFAYLNLALDVYPSWANSLWNMDLILCRNVLIYLDPDIVRLIAQRLYDTLAEGGWLITASSDPPLWEHAPFKVETMEEGVFYRRPCGGAIPSIAVPKIATPETQAEPLPARSMETSSKSAHRPLLPESDSLREAKQALERGDYRSAVELTTPLRDDAAAAILHVRALANLETAEAERACAQMVALHPLSAELHQLHAVLLLALNRQKEAIQATRHVLYLDRTLAIAHFMLGSMLRDRGDRAGALRAFRNARDLCAGRPADEVIPLADGEQAGRLAHSAGGEMALLEAAEGSS